MKEWLKEHSLLLYLGFSLGFYVPITSVGWWLIIIPSIILLFWRESIERIK